MKTQYRIFAVAFALAVIIGASMFTAASVGGVDFASFWPHASAVAAIDLAHNIVPHMAFGLVAMRAELATLEKRAIDKMAEIKDDTSADQARSIEDDHKKILAEIAAKRAEIAKEEQEDASRSQPTTQTNTHPTDANRSADILDIGTRANMPVTDIQDAIRSGASLDVFRARAFDYMVSQVSQTRTTPARILQDERDVARNAQIEAMAYRIGAPLPQAGPSAAARQHMGNGLIRLAMSCTDERNYPETARAREELFDRAAHTTSDFPIIMEGSINRTLEARYRLVTPTYRTIARQRNFRDFRPHTTIKTGDFPMLEKIKESGEIKYGTLVEGKETLSVASYAVAIALSRQLMINDDLGALQEMLDDYGSTVALFEEVTFYSEAFNGKLHDGLPVFHADHNNLGVAAAITVDSVGLGRAAMGKQKTLSGNPMMANAPSFLVTGPDKQLEAEKLVSSITPATVDSVNIFSGRLTPFSSSQIEAMAWHLFADPAIGSNYRWGYLEGYEAPRVRMENPFGRQGMAMSVEHDFGCGAVDYRYGYMNPGE
ncbi:Skp family chaperone for outer membrane proteins [Agrobacterium vitis]|nr:Skp family chaperone for outer membrane proteins [Agrobacterium vitis]MBE1437071.1 Skp family chaperone for outer membrane proteins [Agrobacterium vitis]